MTPLTQRIGAITIALVLALAGCGTELGGVLYIVGNTVPESSTCLVQAQGGGGQQKFRPNGEMDLSLTDRYRVYFMVVNEAPQFESVSGFEAEDGRVDQSKVLLDTATVSLFMSKTVVDTFGPAMNDLSQVYGFSAPMWDPANCDDFQCFTQYTLPISAELLPGATAAVIFDLLPANHGRIFRQLPLFVNNDNSLNLTPGPVTIPFGGADLELVFEVSLAGVRHDGKQVSTELFRYPVKVCNNCLVQDIYERAVALNPLNPGEGFEPITAQEIVGDLCSPGSDEKVSNAWCGFMFGQDDGGDAAVRQCRLTRCIDGVGSVAPGGAPQQTLYCDGDGVSYGANFFAAP